MWRALFPLSCLPVFAVIAIKADLTQRSLNLWFQLPCTYHCGITIRSITALSETRAASKRARLSLAHKEETKPHWELCTMESFKVVGGSFSKSFDSCTNNTYLHPMCKNYIFTPMCSHEILVTVLCVYIIIMSYSLALEI